jgi:hypothetical protein
MTLKNSHSYGNDLCPLEAARGMIREHGYLEALRLSEEMRDKSSPGTTTFAIWNATVKQIKLAATIGRLEASEPSATPHESSQSIS